MNPQPRQDVGAPAGAFSFFENVKQSDRPRGPISLAQLHEWITIGKAYGIQPITARARTAFATHGKGAEYDAHKYQLPCATVSGIFSHRTAAGLTAHSGYVVLDFDGLPDDRDQAAMVDELSAHSSVALAARSCADGVWAAVAVSPVPQDGDEHKAAWAAVADEFSAMQGNIDDGGKDVSRLRFIAHDPHAVLKQPSGAVAWTMPVASAETSQTPQRPTTHRKYSDHDLEQILSVLDPDMAHDDWVHIGMALHAGGYSVEQWDRWSATGSKYKPGECARRWASFKEGGGISMGTLIATAKAAGWQPPQRQQTQAPADSPPAQHGGEERTKAPGISTTLTLKQDAREKVVIDSADKIAGAGNLIALFDGWWAKRQNTWENIDDYAVGHRLQEAAIETHNTTLHSTLVKEARTRLAVITRPRADADGLITRSDRGRNIRLDTGKPIDGAVFGNEVVSIDGADLHRRPVDENDFIVSRRPYQLPALNTDDAGPLYEFLEASFGEAHEEKKLLLQFGGRALMQYTDDHRFAILLGPGRSGKGAWLRLLALLCGAGQSTAYSSLSELGGRFQTARLKGKALATIGDLAARPRGTNQRDLFLAGAAVLKSVVGQDAVTIERKGKESEAMRLDVSFFAAANHPPAFLTSGADATAWRERMLIVRFPHEVPQGERVEGIDRRLYHDCGPEIAAAMISEFLYSRRNGGYTLPASHKQAMAALVEDALSMAERFVRDRIQFGGAGEVAKSVLTDTLEKYVTSEGLAYKTTHRNQLYRLLREQCTESKGGGRSNETPRFKGLTLLQAGGK